MDKRSIMIFGVGELQESIINRAKAKGLFVVGIDPCADELTVNPKIRGLWKWFALENITFKGQSYNVYYDEDGDAFGKGKGVIIEKI